MDAKYIIATDFWCFGDVLFELTEAGKIDSYLTDKQKEDLVKRIKKMIDFQGYPDAQTFRQMCLDAYAEIIK